MNAPTISKVSTLKWLLKREYWENRGGFLWAPVIAGGISLLLTALAIGAGLLAANRAAVKGELHVNGVNVNGLDLELLTRQMTPESMAQLAHSLDMTLLVSSAWPFIVLAFVVFFYCLGALYDDRRDRSVLFWKSLPISDTQTVLSKALSALVIAPAIALAAALLTSLGFLLMISAVVLAYGGNPFTLIWGQAHLGALLGAHLSWLVLYAFWALPTVGWLLFCSAWARSKPFLWAVLLPVFAGVVVSWFNYMNLISVSDAGFWSKIVGRGLLSAVPHLDLAFRYDAESPWFNSFYSAFSAGSQWAAFTTPALWIGAAVGIALLAGAVVLRRYRNEL